MGMDFKAHVRMKNIGDKQVLSKFLSYLKKDSDFDIEIETDGNDFVSLSSYNNMLYENFNEAIEKLSKEYPQNIVCYDNYAECTNVCSVVDMMSFTKLYMKNGVDILKYDQKFRPVYCDELKKGCGLALDLDKFEKELDERKKKIENDDYDFLSGSSELMLPTGHDVYFKKPLQRYYKIVDGKIENEMRISYEEFVSFFDKSELDIFKDTFEPCDNINNDEIETGFNDENDKYYIKGLKISSSFDEYVEKYCK